MHPTLLSYLQLFRLPNVFTAIANVAMGFLLVQQGVAPIKAFAFLVVASSLLYTAGMVLNDVFDFEIDLKERPDRPLPSGRIQKDWAKQLGFGMLVGGVILTWFVSFKSGIIGTLLATSVLLYDASAKKGFWGAIVMGSCRTLNILLGMSLANPTFPILGFEAYQWMIAIGVGVYVMGITIFAKSEAETSDKRRLNWGFAVMSFGIMLLASFPWFTDIPIKLRGELLWPTLLMLLMASVVRRCVTAIFAPTSGNVQQAIKHSLFTLILLDAAVVLAMVGPLPAVAIVGLLVPSVLLGKWVYST